MLPGKQKVDISSFSDQEKELFQKYGKVPTHKNLLSNKLKERKYFDSGDYAMSKAGVSPQSSVGTAIPSPADIPHASPPQHSSSNSGAGLSTSPSQSSTSPGSIPIGSPSSQAAGGASAMGMGTSPTSSGGGVGVGQAVYGSPSKEPISQHRAHQ
ncbi:hypothetical protein JCM11491_004142 [Sporobolomyces phaffii]